MIHWLKTHAVPFDEVWNSLKTYELRLNDRQYAVGNVLILGEGIQDTRAPRAIIARVDSIRYSDESFGALTDRHVALGLTVLGRISSIEPELELFTYQKSTHTCEQWSGFRKVEVT